MLKLDFLRALASTLSSRARIGGAAGSTFGGKRNVFDALGYKQELTPTDYWFRYKRNAVAARVVEAYPRSTWRGIAGELVENPDPKTLTAFERAWFDFSERLKIWPILMRADILSGLGRFSIVLIGAPGDASTPLPNPLKPEEITFLKPYSERDVEVDTIETGNNARFGQPTIYNLKQSAVLGDVKVTKTIKGTDQKVHWTRTLHIADGLLDDNIYGQPRQERVWNLLDDLEKVTGAGSEAFWLRAHQGYQFDIDKETKLDSEGEEDLQAEVDDFVNGISRAVRTRGVDLQVLGSDVATFDRNVDSIISQISSGTSIPQRILMGSERGQLASQQDRVNWAERVQDRRTEYAGPLIVRPFVDRLIEYQVLPKPSQYEVRWPQIYDLSDDERAKIASTWAEINMKNGGDKDSTRVVVVPNEIRDIVLGMAPINKRDLAEMEKREEEERKSKEAKPFGGGQPKPAGSAAA